MSSHIFINSPWQEVQTLAEAIEKTQKGNTILVVTAPPGWKYNFETDSFEVVPIDLNEFSI